MNKNELYRNLVSQIEIKIIIHSTEDEGKVKKVIRSLIPEISNGLDAKIKPAKGYYGNPIKILTLSTLNRGYADIIFNSILSRLNKESKILFANTLNERLDSKGNLYLRFDKQSFELKLRDDDPIRIKIRLKKLVNTSLKQIILGSKLNEKLH